MRRLSLLLILLLAGCGTNQYGDYTYDDFPSINDWSELATTGANDSITMVYYYNRDFFGTDCSGCQIVNTALFEYGKTNTDNVELILVNERTAMGIRPLSLNRQPTVFFLQDGEITYQVFAAQPILEMLENMETGSFEWALVEGEINE